MKKKMKRMIILFAVMTLLTTAVFGISAEAKARRKDGKYVIGGYVYIYKNGRPRTGYFHYKGKSYYGHKTGTNVYPKGSCTAGDMRIRNGKWYAYGTDGAKIKKDLYVRKGSKKILQLDIRHRDHTVRYVYGTARGNLGSRYSTKLGRMQYYEAGEWHDVEGMPFYPGYVDMQK